MLQIGNHPFDDKNVVIALILEWILSAYLLFLLHLLSKRMRAVLHKLLAVAVKIIHPENHVEI